MPSKDEWRLKGRVNRWRGTRRSHAGLARTESIEVSDDKGVKVVIHVIYFAST